MSSEEFDLMAGFEEAAWSGFRSRLADRIAEIEDDECLLIEMEVGIDDDELDRAAPYVQFMGWGEGMVRGEVVSNHYLDDRFLLSADDEALLGELGWLAPTHGLDEEADSGSANFHVDLEVREADRLAVMVVRALREVFGCVHPMFLDADGLEQDPENDARPADPAEGDGPDPAAVFPDDRDELRAMVDRALGEMFEEPLRHDGDGDVPIIAGESAVFVRVVADEPAVDLYVELVVDVADVERAELEAGILNRNHPFAKFFVRDDLVVMTHRVSAFPFAGTQLRSLLARMLAEVDDLARDLALRVGGRRFFDVPEEQPSVEDATDEPGDAPSCLTGLVEMLHDGPARPRLVAALFDNDRREIIAQLVRLRTGVDDPGGHDLELVLGQLRAALRFVAEFEALPEVRRPLPPKPDRTRQLALLPDCEDTLDAGLWGQDHLEDQS